MKVTILQVDDYEAIYLDGELLDQAHKLGEGNSRTYLLRMAETYGFSSKDITERFLEDDLAMHIYESGTFPNNLKDLI